jgi:hypothetical protein
MLGLVVRGLYGYGRRLMIGMSSGKAGMDFKREDTAIEHYDLETNPRFQSYRT